MAKNQVMWTPEEVQLLLDMHASGSTLPEVSAKLGRSITGVSAMNHRLGIRFERHNRRFVNKRVFVDLTEESAWLLGLLYADGSFGKRPASVALASVDEDLVLSMKRIMQADYPIYVVEPGQLRGGLGKQRQYRLTINGGDLLETVYALGAKRLKPERTQLPAIPSELVRHFIRGYFDGDGTCSTVQGLASFCGVSGLMETIRAQLVENGVRCSAISHRSPTPWIGAFSVSSRSGLDALFGYMYDGATTYGIRKHDAWVQVLAAKGIA